MSKTGPRRTPLGLATSLILVGSAFVGLHGTGVVAPVEAADTAVAITDYAYTPNPLTVTAGSVVTWTNAAGQDHTVTSDSGATLASGTLGPGDAYGNLFDTPGTYAYHCEIHPARMKGTIIVVAAAATPIASGSAAPTPPAGTLPPDFETPIPGAEASSSPTPSPLPSGGAGGSSSGSSTPLALGLLLVLLVAAILLYAVWRRRRQT
jgi:plastocyanin